MGGVEGPLPVTLPGGTGSRLAGPGQSHVRAVALQLSVVLCSVPVKCASRQLQGELSSLP